MARIAGVDLPKDKRIEIGLTYVYGIGRTSANKILEMTGINPDTRVKDLTDEEEAKIRECTPLWAGVSLFVPSFLGRVGALYPLLR